LRSFSAARTQKGQQVLDLGGEDFYKGFWGQIQESIKKKKEKGAKKRFQRNWREGSGRIRGIGRSSERFSPILRSLHKMETGLGN
jgi:hypothetical protein